jgi:hypothetical protein
LEKIRVTDIFVYQILTHNMTRMDLDPACRVLDNSANERPDWFEYWPIRKFFLDAQLEEDAYYSFLSPRFKEKTNLRVAAAMDFVNDQNGHADVVIFTPSLHLTAYYWNVFQYGEACHPGLVKLATEFFERIGSPTDLQELVTHSQNEVYSNYFFAKPIFWRTWLKITESLIAIAESPDDSFGQRLRKPTSYRGRFDAQIKIFIMERIPTWLLARNSEFIVRVRDPFAVRSRLYKLPGAIMCDALKIAYVSNNRQQRYRDMFSVVSKLGKPISWFFRLGYFLGFRNVRWYLDRLGTYWTRAGRL